MSDFDKGFWTGAVVMTVIHVIINAIEIFIR
jgi:hypothetical protein